MTTWRYGCGALVDTSAPVEVVPASCDRPPFRDQYIYRCAGCGAEVYNLDGSPLTGEIRHGQPVEEQSADDRA